MNKIHSVYVITDGKFTKIGVSQNVEKRLKALQTSNASKLSICGYVEMNSVMQAYAVEKEVHRVYNKYRVKGEWFKQITADTFIRKIHKVKDKHSLYVESHRKLYTELLRERVKPDDLKDFLLKTKELGATQYGIDVSDYEDFESAPICLYALTSSSKKGGNRVLVGAISRSGTKIVDDYDSCFSSKGRKFLLLNI